MSRILWIHIDTTAPGPDGLPVDFGLIVTDEFGDAVDDAKGWPVWESGHEYGNEIDHTAPEQVDGWRRSRLIEEFGSGESYTRDQADKMLVDWWNEQRFTANDALGGFELDWLVVPTLVKHFPNFADNVLGLNLIDLRTIQWLCENVNPELEERISKEVMGDMTPGNTSERSTDTVTRFAKTYAMYLENFIISGDE